MPPARRPQHLEIDQTNVTVSLYPAVPVMRGGTYGAHSPMSSGRPRSPLLGPSPAHRAATPLAGHAYSPAPKSGSMGSVGGITVGSPHVHWADFAFVREVSNIFDRQVNLGLPPHTPEAVENPFRRRTQRQFYMEGETPPAMSASAGTLFTMAPVPQEQAQAQLNSNAMFGGMFAGMGTPVVERPISPSPQQRQQQQQHQHQQPQHFGVAHSAYASGGASHATSSAATARPHVQMTTQPARVRPSTPGVPPGRSSGPTIVQAHGHHQQQQQQQAQQAQQAQAQAQAQLGGAYAASRRAMPRNSISAPSGQAYAYGHPQQAHPSSHSSSGYAYGRSASSWM